MYVTIVLTMMNVYKSQAKNKVFQQHGHTGKRRVQKALTPSFQYLFPAKNHS